VPRPRGGAVVASSSRVRQAVGAGQMAAAAAILGRCFHVNGRVIRGEQRGRTIGFPTANVETSNELLPALGVYSGWLDYGEGAAPAVINLGQKPTFVTDGAPILEAHVLDAQGLDLYGLECRVFFGRHLRDEMAFSGLEALRAQIAVDAERAREHTTTTPAPTLP
jgi:riboflavin kinase/FMN adenylyltransferase